MSYRSDKRNGSKYIFAVICVIVFAFVFGIVLDLMITKVEYSIYKKPDEYSEFVEKYSEKYDVPEHVIYSVIKAESGFDELAKSSAGAMGLMQMMPETFDDLAFNHFKESVNSSSLYDPETSIKYGTYYLSYLYDRYGDWSLVFAAYNGGLNKVNEWLKDEKYSTDGKNLTHIPFKETRKYVSRVEKNVEKYDDLYKE